MSSLPTTMHLPPTVPLPPVKTPERRRVRAAQLRLLLTPRNQNRIVDLLLEASIHDVQVGAISHQPRGARSPRHREAERYAARKIFNSFKQLRDAGREVQFDPRAVTKVFSDSGMLVGTNFRSTCNRLIGRTEHGFTPPPPPAEEAWTGYGLQPWDSSYSQLMPSRCVGWTTNAWAFDAQAEEESVGDSGWGGGGWGGGGWGSGSGMTDAEAVESSWAEAGWGQS
ncbi:hypothetical protein C8R47DRAFT_1209583 [Mycena vitilis]|nr:hypothetical protein C8R47DRAFT_1209583 [Mycena vitilis]